MFIIEEHSYKALGYLLAVGGSGGAPGEKRPTLLYLHGAGKRGRDLSLLRGFSVLFGNACAQEAGLRICAPQCCSDSWFDIFEQLIEFADFIRSDPGTDPERYYLCGASMGGYAAWQLAMSRPELFAAVTPICGGGMYWNAQRLKDIPIWAFHGENDRRVFLSESVNMVDAVNAAGGHAKLTVYPGVEHNAWSPTFSDPAYWDWIVSQRRRPENSNA